MKRFGVLKQELIDKEREVFQKNAVGLIQRATSKPGSAAIYSTTDHLGAFELRFLRLGPKDEVGESSMLTPSSSALKGSFKGETVSWDVVLPDQAPKWAVRGLKSLTNYASKQMNWGMYALYDDWCVEFIDQHFKRALSQYLRVQTVEHTLIVNVYYLLAAVHEALDFRVKSLDSTTYRTVAPSKYGVYVADDRVQHTVVLYAVSALLSLQQYTSEKTGVPANLHTYNSPLQRHYHSYSHIFDPAVNGYHSPTLAYRPFLSSTSFSICKRNSYKISGLLLMSTSTSQNFVDGQPSEMIVLTLKNVDASYRESRSHVVRNSMLHVIWYVGRWYNRIFMGERKVVHRREAVTITDGTGMMWRFNQSKSEWVQPTPESCEFFEQRDFMISQFYIDRILKVCDIPIDDIESASSPFFYITEPSFKEFMERPLVYLSKSAKDPVLLSSEWMRESGL